MIKGTGIKEIDALQTVFEGRICVCSGTDECSGKPNNRSCPHFGAHIVHKGEGCFGEGCPELDKPAKCVLVDNAENRRLVKRHVAFHYEFAKNIKTTNLEGGE